MNIVKILLVIVAVLILAFLVFAGQKVETVDGVRLVHNTGLGAWGKTPKVTLEPVRALGDVGTADENLAFYMPANLILDVAGNMYVLDSGNHRIQILTPDGKDHKTIRFLEGMAGDVFCGRPGELVMGPARFQMRFTPDEPEGLSTGGRESHLPPPRATNLSIILCGGSSS